MKKILFSLALMMFAFAQINAQKNYPAEPFVASKEGWEVDLQKAFAKSQATGKPILANFTGVKWCGWCKRLDQTVFSKPEFQNWAKKNVILLELDFPRRYQLPANIASQNRSLQQAFGVRGYPTIHVFDLNQEAGGRFNISNWGKTGYAKNVGDFTGAVEQMLAKRKAESGAGR